MVMTSAAGQRQAAPRSKAALHFPIWGPARTAPAGAMVGGYGSREQVTRELLRAADVVVAMIVFAVAVAATGSDAIVTVLDHSVVVQMTPRDIAVAVGLFAVWPVLFTLFGLYPPRARSSGTQEAARIAGACSLGVLAALLVLPTGGHVLRSRTLLFFWIGVLVATVLIRRVVRLRLVPVRAEARQTLIVGSGPLALRLHAHLMADAATARGFVGFVDSSVGLLAQIGQERLGTLDELERILMHRVVDEVLIALPVKSCYAEIQNVIDICERVGIEARYPADCFQHRSRTVQYDAAGALLPLVSLSGAPDAPRLTVKRVVDTVGAAVGLVLLAPLLLATAVAIKLTSPGPVFFVQTRYGYNKRPFRMYKFRTMVANAEALQDSLEGLNEADGPAFKIRRDPRVTPTGRLLRRTSLDELPQLVNVLKGDMSLVGPRPLPVRDVHRFAEARLMRRFSVLPGCTCLWQISGRSDLSFDDWVALDLRYIDQWSLALDLKILLRTVPAVLRGTGAA